MGDSEEQRLLVLASRSPARRPIVVPGTAHPVSVYGGAPNVGEDEVLPADGPTF